MSYDEIRRIKKEFKSFIEDLKKEVKKDPLQVEKAAKTLSMSIRHVYNCLENGSLSGFKIGEKKGWRVLVDSVIVFLIYRIWKGLTDDDDESLKSSVRQILKLNEII